MTHRHTTCRGCRTLWPPPTCTSWCARCLSRIGVFCGQVINCTEAPLERMVQQVKHFAGDATTTRGIASNIMDGINLQCLIDYLQPTHQTRQTRKNGGPVWDDDEAGQVMLMGAGKPLPRDDPFRQWYAQAHPTQAQAPMYEHDRVEVRGVLGILDTVVDNATTFQYFAGCADGVYTCAQG